jgi:hypothetical protein
MAQGRHKKQKGKRIGIGGGVGWEFWDWEGWEPKKKKQKGLRYRLYWNGVCVFFCVCLFFFLIN